MPKRKREQLDTGRTNDRKKSTHNRKNERGAVTLTEKHEGLKRQQEQDGVINTAAVEEGAESTPFKHVDISQRLRMKLDSDRQKSVKRRARRTQSTSETLALAQRVSIRHDKHEQKVARKERKNSKRRQTGESAKVTDEVSSHRKRSRPKQTTLSQRTKSLWRVSDAIGGQMLDLDPIFALNEEYLLIAYDAAIHVYATSTSLLVRRLAVRKLGKVTAFALSPSNDNHLFLSTNTGLIEKWDWIQGSRLEYWHTSTPIYHLATSIHSPDDTLNDLVYTVDRKGEGQWMLTVHRLLGGNEASKTDLGTLIKYPSPLTSVKILESGRIVVITSGLQLIVGSSDKPNSEFLKDVTYVWREVKCPDWISSMDVRIRPYPKSIAEGNKKSLDDSALDVAIGTLRGKILIYDNLLKNLVTNESDTKSEKMRSLSSQQLHWHRTAVLAMKWSKDGNYVISGGLETVLILWQLETGKKQILPHLSASIESIVVSPSGSSYSVRLADNSNMILSTSELQPTFNVSGIQVAAGRRSGMSLPFIPTVDAPTQASVSKKISGCPAILNPVMTGRLLAAVPSSTASRLLSGAPNAACYLQTFDIGSAQQMSKQSLARTKATTLNMGPEANLIEEPSVVHMQISCDGQWLATIDEWQPPRRDISWMAVDSEREAEEQSRRRETYLKFWVWNDNVKTWELVSRIDNPHSSRSNIRFEANSVLELRSDPSRVGFATMGHESTLKFWKSSVRRRHGHEVRDRTGRAMSNWSCHYTASLESPQAAIAPAQQGAKLAYSGDGSVLAAGYRLSSPSVIHLIKTDNGTIQRTLTALHRGPLLGLAISDRYLITLSHELRVWDMVTEQHTFGFALQPCGLSTSNLVASTHLAIDSQEETFAVSLPEGSQSSRSSKPNKSQIIIFNPKSAEPLFSTSTANSTAALLPAPGRKGYYILDSAAEIRTLAPILPVSSALKGQQPHQALKPKESKGPKGLENIYGNGTSAPLLKSDDEQRGKRQEEQNDESQTKKKGSRKSETMPAPPKPSVIRLERPDIPIVTQDALAELFEKDSSSPFALPPIMELYEQVARLCVGKGGKAI